MTGAFYGPHLEAYPIKWYDHKSEVWNDYTGLYELRFDDAEQVYVYSVPRSGYPAGRKLATSVGGQLKLSKDGITCAYLTHRLFVMTVIGPPPADGNYTVDHIDRDHTNNSAYNLRWATPEQQAANRRDLIVEMKWVSLDDNEQMLVPRQFQGHYFIETGFKIRETKNGWLKAVNRKKNNRGYYLCHINDQMYLMHRIITYLFGGKDGVCLDDIDDAEVKIEHLDDDKTNNHKNNLRVSTQKNNVESWHASGKSNKRRVYAMSVGDSIEKYEFESAAEASRKFPKASRSHIGEVCKGKHQTAGGFYWSFEPFD